MNRLLKISLDLTLLSFIPILLWFFLGIIIDDNLINIFTLTYPLQFVYYIMKSIFSTGANISQEKDKNENAVMSGLTLGIVFCIVIYGLILLNVDSYISFMNMDINIYKTFTVFSILLLFFQTIFSFILEKLYYEEKNTLANHYSLIFNFLYFIVLIVTALITKNQLIIVSVTLILLGLFTIYILIKSWDNFKFNLNILNCIKYDSLELSQNISYFFIFLFGLSNALEFGEEFALAITFSALITDTQWDVIDSISTVIKIDLSKNKFNYIEHRNNAFKLVGLLIFSSIMMFLLMYWFYDLNLNIVILFFTVEIVNFILYPLFTIKSFYLQLEWSSIKTSTNEIFSLLTRFLFSFLSTPFCTAIGQLVSAIYKLISFNFIFNKHYKIDKLGNVIEKNIVKNIN